MRYLVEQGENINAPGSRYGGTALHGAIVRNNANIIKYLLEVGADPNICDFSRVFPLHTVVVRDDQETIALLLQHGASVEAANIDGDSLLDYTADVFTQRMIMAQMEAEKNQRPREKRVLETQLRPMEQIDHFVQDSSGLSSFTIDL